MWNKLIKLLVTSCAFALVILLAGCHPPITGQTISNVDEVTARDKAADAMMVKKLKPMPTLSVKQEPYVDKTPIPLIHEPTWVKRSIIIRGYQLPFSYYASTILGGGRSGLLVNYQPGLDTSMNLSVNYSGSIKGALNLLAAKSGYVYTIHERSIDWVATITRTMDVAFIPGSTDYMVGKQAGSTGGSGGTSSGGGGSGGSSSTTAVSGFLDDTAQSQYSSIKGTISLWKELDTTIKQMMSPIGKAIVSESTTSVTITDRPQNVASVTQYITNLNANMSRQVFIKVEVLEIQLGKAYNYGVNWTIVQEAFGHSLWQLNNSTPGAFVASSNPAINSIVGSGAAATANAALVPNPQANAISGSSATSGGTLPLTPVTFFQALITALEAQGRITVVSQPRIICLNNQVSTIRVINQNGYVASTQTTISGGGGTQGSTSTQLTPGTITTGITMYVLPKIMKTKVYLQITGDLSTLLGLTTFNSATGTNGLPTGTAAQGSSTVQLPNVSDKQFNQRVVLHSGETLILSGMRKTNNQTQDANPFQMAALGTHGVSQATDETLILITPTILPEFS